MAEIMAEPFAFPLRRDAAALIVIDMQRDFAEPGAALQSALPSGTPRPLAHGATAEPAQRWKARARAEALRR